MNVSAETFYLVLGGGVFGVASLLILAFSSDSLNVEKRLARVGQTEGTRINAHDRSTLHGVRSTKDSAIPLLDRLIKMLPNPDKLRARLAGTGMAVTLGEYLLMNALAIALFFFLFNLLHVNQAAVLPGSIVLGLGLPHAVTGFLMNRRIKKFLGSFPEAIDTMCRGIRSGLPITESIAAVGREMPDPVGIEFHRIADGVRMGKTLEDSMWEVAHRINTPEFRFLIIAMAIQKETGGNLAETLSNLAELIRKRRQLRQKVKAMSSEAKASAMIIGSLPFIMFFLLTIVNPDYVNVLLNEPKGRFLLGGGLFWMSLGWGVMLKMIHFEM